MNITKKVFVFEDETGEPAQAGQFDQYCAFGESELEAKLKLQTRHQLYGRTLRLVKTFDDRRKSTERRGDTRGTDRRAE